MNMNEYIFRFFCLGLQGWFKELHRERKSVRKEMRGKQYFEKSSNDPRDMYL